MYGLMVIAKIENLENAPPDIRFINPLIPSVDDIAELNTVMSGQMTKMMPIMMLLIMINLPGALVFYYLISNIMTGVQQKYILNKSSTEMEISADKKLIRELNKIEEGQVVKESGKKVTKITAKSKRSKFRKHK